MSDSNSKNKGGLELRVCNSQPSEPFIYWGGHKFIEAHLITLVYAKKIATTK